MRIKLDNLRNIEHRRLKIIKGYVNRGMASLHESKAASFIFITLPIFKITYFEQPRTIAGSFLLFF